MRIMTPEDLFRAGEIAGHEDRIWQFMTEMKKESPELKKSLDFLCVQYLKFLQAQGLRLDSYEMEAFVNEFFSHAAFILAGLHSLNGKFPQVSPEHVKEAVKGYARREEIARRIQRLVSFGEYSKWWIEGFVTVTEERGFDHYGRAYIYVLADVFLEAAEAEERAMQEERELSADVARRTERLKRKDRRLLTEIDEILAQFDESNS